MSRIYFHSIDGEETAVSGSERAYFGNYCSGLMIEALRFSMEDTDRWPSPIRQLLPQSSYLLHVPDFQTALKTYFRVGDIASGGGKMTLNGEEISTFTMSLNTAIAAGSDPVRLGARLHGQCEIHAYVEGENRAWLADIIRQGRESYFLREDAGWESVIELLERDDSAPVVTSYSVTEAFPNSGLDPEIPPFPGRDDPGLREWEKLADDWYDIPHKVQFERCMVTLRESGGWKEMTPDRWEDYFFGDGLNAFKFAEMLRELKERRGN